MPGLLQLRGFQTVCLLLLLPPPLPPLLLHPAAAAAASCSQRLLRGWLIGTRCTHCRACHRTTLPLKKGLSSSAALCVLVARAFNQAYGLRLTTRGEMQYAYDGERMTPSQVGGKAGGGCWLGG